VEISTEMSAPVWPCSRIRRRTQRLRGLGKIKATFMHEGEADVINRDDGTIDEMVHRLTFL
jgi:hypothetical protein